MRQGNLPLFHVPLFLKLKKSPKTCSLRSQVMGQRGQILNQRVISLFLDTVTIIQNNTFFKCLVIFSFYLNFIQ